MIVMTAMGERVRMYGAVIQTMRPSLDRIVCRNQDGLAEILLGSYLRATDNYGALSSASRWHSGARTVPLVIANYYSTAEGRAKMRTDIEEGVIPHIVAPDTLVADIIMLVSSGLVLDNTVQVRLLRHRPDGAEGDLAAMLADILCYAMQ